jgi:hypothetical protein
MFQTLQADQRQRWQEGDRIRVADYLVKYPSLASDISTLTNLLASEIAIRKAYGEIPSLDEYLNSFPQCASELRKQFASPSGTSLRGVKRAVC